MNRYSILMRIGAGVALAFMFMVGAQAAAAPMGDLVTLEASEDCDPFIDEEDCNGWMCAECEEEYGYNTTPAWICCLGGIFWCENYCYWPL